MLDVDEVFFPGRTRFESLVREIRGELLGLFRGELEHRGPLVSFHRERSHRFNLGLLRGYARSLDLLWRESGAHGLVLVTNRDGIIYRFGFNIDRRMVLAGYIGLLHTASCCLAMSCQSQRDSGWVKARLPLPTGRAGFGLDAAEFLSVRSQALRDGDRPGMGARRFSGPKFIAYKIPLPSETLPAHGFGGTRLSTPDRQHSSEARPVSTWRTRRKSKAAH